MKCPFCNNEMTKGYIQSGQHILWTQKKHNISLIPINDNEIILSKKLLGGSSVSGHICKNCKKIILEY